MNEAELERRLLIVSEINYRVDRLIVTCGTAAVTAERITEIAAEAILDNMEGFNLEQFHICPGYGGTHVWAMKNHVPTGDLRRMVERCSSHPERRTKERRR